MSKKDFSGGSYLVYVDLRTESETKTRKVRFRLGKRNSDDWYRVRGTSVLMGFLSPIQCLRFKNQGLVLNRTVRRRVLLVASRIFSDLTMDLYTGKWTFDPFNPYSLGGTEPNRGVFVRDSTPKFMYVN